MKWKATEGSFLVFRILFNGRPDCGFSDSKLRFWDTVLVGIGGCFFVNTRTSISSQKNGLIREFTLVLFQRYACKTQHFWGCQQKG